jgi:NAD(P)-dependent dehydrogenase (short-subunit alcohol dehydrogenase family)
MKLVKNQLVLVTGGAGGIGRLMALGFARRGARVAVWDVNEESLKVLEAEALKEGLFIRAILLPSLPPRGSSASEGLAITAPANSPPLALTNLCAWNCGVLKAG